MSDDRFSLIEVALQPRSDADRAKFEQALAKLAVRDPSLQVSIDQESRHTVLKGMSELHLDRAIDALKRSYGLDVNVGAPQVSFQERVTRRAEITFTHKKQVGGTGEFAAVTIVVEPNTPDKGNAFESKVASGVMPDAYIPGVEKGVREVLRAGVVAGFPVVNAKVQLVDAKYHDVDSSAPAFEIAARAALREALQLGVSKLFEPIMQIEVTTPERFAREIIDDLNLRRGQIRSQEAVGTTSVVTATVPLMNMFGYVNSLRVTSLGRATFTIQFSHYAQAPSPDDDPPFGSAVGMRA